MAFSTQQNFIGELDGVTVNDINQKIDYSKTKLEERKQEVQNILDDTKFYEEYFSGYFKAAINCGDSLSSDVNVCKSLERMATYILNSDEIKEEEDSEKTQYVFHKDPKYFQKKMDREQSIEALSNTETGAHEDSIIHFLKRNEPNYKNDKTQTISKEDLERDDFLGEVLTSYDKLLEFVTSELKNTETKYNRYLLTKIKGQLLNDMTYSKDCLLGIFGYDLRNFYESNKPNIDVFDFTNEFHVKGSKITFINHKGKEKEIQVKGLMHFKPDFDPTNDFSFVLMDFEETVKKAGLTEDEQYVLDATRDGSTQEEIAEELGTYHRKISRVLDKIAEKIIAVGNKYDG